MIRRAVVLLATVSVSLGAQRYASSVVAPVVRDSACTYSACALGLAPVWNALDVTRGATGEHLASLGFFLPGNVAAAFAGSDSAQGYAGRAVRVRRVAAVLTDGGAVLIGAAVLHGLSSGHFSAADRVAAGAGTAAFAASVPLQFSADALLSRAVWWYNARFIR